MLSTKVSDQATGIKAHITFTEASLYPCLILDGIKILAMPQVFLKISQLSRQKETYTEANF